MFPVKSIFAAIAMTVATPLTLATPAYAQGTNVIVIDRAQILTQSKAGQDVATKIQGIESAMQAELQPTALQLQTEGTAIEAKTANMTPEAMRVFPKVSVPAMPLSNTERIQPPSLLRAYLRLGVRICGELCLDEAFGVADAMILLRREDMNHRYLKRILR